MFPSKERENKMMFKFHSLFIQVSCELRNDFFPLGINYFCHFDYPQKKKLQNTDIFLYVSFEEKDKTLQRMASLQRVF